MGRNWGGNGRDGQIPAPATKTRRRGLLNCRPLAPQVETTLDFVVFARKLRLRSLRNAGFEPGHVTFSSLVRRRRLQLRCVPRYSILEGGISLAPQSVPAARRRPQILRAGGSVGQTPGAPVTKLLTLLNRFRRYLRVALVRQGVPPGTDGVTGAILGNLKSM
jgi:hypothetical protein